MECFHRFLFLFANKKKLVLNFSFRTEIFCPLNPKSVKSGSVKSRAILYLKGVQEETLVVYFTVPDYLSCLVLIQIEVLQN
jgi:hypothetical protein